MRLFGGAKRLGTVLVSCALFSGLIITSPANASSDPSSKPISHSLLDSEVLANPESFGRIERDASKAAKYHLTRNAGKWGIDSDQFQPTVAIDGLAGMSIVRFKQSVNRVEVANSLLAITVNGDGSLLSYTKSISDYSGRSKAEISQTEAKAILKVKLAKRLGISPSKIIVSEIKLVVVDSSLVNDVPIGRYLAWQALTSIINDVTSVSMTYLSQNGKQVLSSLPFVRGITSDPFVCDLQTDTPDYVRPKGVTEGRTSETRQNRYVDISRSSTGLPLCGVNTSGRIIDPENVAVVNITRTWDYFSSVLGQDISREKFLGNVSESINGDLTPRISAFIDVCVTGQSCPYGNAFWVPWRSSDCSSGICSGIFLGKGFDNSDDVIAHELAHGVTFALAFNSPVAANTETDALSEAMSDIFGEAMDQLSVRPDEAADSAWTIGEDSRVGGIRTMKMPSVLRIDKNWRPRGGHYNNGPVNRLAFLLANGGAVGSVRINPLGSTANTITDNDLCDAAGECLGTVRMSQLVFATLSNLTATATYFEFGRAMNNACFSLLKSKAIGFTTSACKSTQSALIAQGFASASIKLAQLPASITRKKPLNISASMQAINGKTVAGHKLTLQVLVGKKWSTTQSRSTDSSGNASFSVKLNAKREYRFRVVSYSNSGLYSITSNSSKIKVS